MFCFHCGAPQVLLSQELRDVAEQQQAPADGADGAATPATQQLDPTVIQWQPMLKLVAGVSACFGLFSFLLPLSLFAPAIAMSLYTSRFRQARVTAGLGARIGLLCGIIVSAVTGTIGAISSLILRVRSHGDSAFDDAFRTQIQQFRDQLTAQHTPDVAGTTAFLNIPEFRAGMMLCGAALMIAIFLGVISAAGALAGYTRSRAPGRAAL
ncbi:hypothetical protein SAMN05421819_3154 [Bryocella elongata]|uniref:Uncharacterized protein n=1 Tax=Bryocella elongata TaxID=863522 RepID=A0A1H6AH98_9BACT|nr:hypothetical protein SAMN05421819_3154 [Bryocella elongata]